MPEPIAAKKRALMKKPTFDEFFAKHSDKNAKPYEFREHYHENVIVTHPKFGKGFVSEIVSDSKVEVTFKDARRVLVHNRKNMPGLPLAAEGDGVASNSRRCGEEAARARPSQGRRPQEAAAPVKARHRPQAARAPRPPSPSRKRAAKPARLGPRRCRPSGRARAAQARDQGRQARQEVAGGPLALPCPLRGARG